MNWSNFRKFLFEYNSVLEELRVKRLAVDHPGRDLYREFCEIESRRIAQEKGE